jgi:Zn-dependent protease
MHWWVSDLFETDKALLVSWVFWVIFSICLHELGHGRAAIALGDRTPIEMGHMTWNPLVHMGKVSLIVFLVSGIAWGLMPISPSRLRGRYAEAKVAAAGPVVNLGLAVVCTVALAVWKKYAGSLPPALYENFQTFFLAGGFLNLLLMALNLLPAPPLDGSKILADFSPGYRRWIDHPNAPMVGLIAAVLIMNATRDQVSLAAGRAVMDGAFAIMLRLP